MHKYFLDNYSILIVGDKNHPEVIGINGWCNNSAIISKDGEDLDKLAPKICVVSQTTEKEENWQKVLNKVVSQCNEIVAFNTICNATQVRQKSAEELSHKADIMIILGGKNSSNTTKLYEICKNNCKNTIHVENANEIPDNIKNKNDYIIGVTAGASTPDWIIKEAIIKMNEDKNLELNEQLEYMDKNDMNISIGQIVEGEVTSISSNNRECFVNIGYKSDALLPITEVTKEEDIDLSSLIKKGERIKAKIISLGSEMNPPVISLIELNRENAYKEIKDCFINNKRIYVKIKDVVNGGLISLYKNIIRVFIPASHIELNHVEDLHQYLGNELEVNIIEFDDSKNTTRIVASRREILQEKKTLQENETWGKLEKDMIVEGEVKRLTNFGAFVEIDGVDGLLHISEMSWGRITNPSDLLKIGDILKVYIMDINKENKKIVFIYKETTRRPLEWRKYKISNR